MKNCNKFLALLFNVKRFIENHPIITAVLIFILIMGLSTLQFELVERKNIIYPGEELNELETFVISHINNIDGIMETEEMTVTYEVPYPDSMYIDFLKVTVRMNGENFEEIEVTRWPEENEYFNMVKRWHTTFLMICIFIFLTLCVVVVNIIHKIIKICLNKKARRRDG